MNVMVRSSSDNTADKFIKNQVQLASSSASTKANARGKKPIQMKNITELIQHVVN